MGTSEKGELFAGDIYWRQTQGTEAKPQFDSIDESIAILVNCLSWSFHAYHIRLSIAIYCGSENSNRENKTKTHTIQKRGIADIHKYSKHMNKHIISIAYVTTHDKHIHTYCIHAQPSDTYTHADTYLSPMWGERIEQHQNITKLSININ